MSIPVFKRHDVANMDIPSISIGAVEHDNVEGDDAVWSNDLMVNHQVVCTIRVHTGHSGGPIDRATTTRLLDQIIEETKKNINGVGDYRIMDFSVTSFDAEFTESATLGGEIIITMHKVRVYVQV